MGTMVELVIGALLIGGLVLMAWPETEEGARRSVNQFMALLRKLVP